MLRHPDHFRGGDGDASVRLLGQGSHYLFGTAEKDLQGRVSLKGARSPFYNDGGGVIAPHRINGQCDGRIQCPRFVPGLP